jgi:transposase InsO family protein
MRSKGFVGSKSALYRYIEKFEPAVQRTFQRYETKPGEQAQFDWSEYTVMIGTTLTRVYVFCCILGHSRFRIYEASLSQTMASVFEAMENSFIRFGGVPCRIQTDNAKCFIINASTHNLQWNPRYLALCAHYGFEYSRSLPSHPWSKGKVENPFDYLEDQFIRDNQFVSFEEFIRRLELFQNEVNNRQHGTTKQTPVSLFEQERSYLHALPETRYVGVKEQVRKVTSDCLISFDGCRYSVPSLFALREVWLRVSKGYLLEVYSTNNILIASHRISPEKGRIIAKNEHYVNHLIERGNWDRLCQSFLALFPDQEAFLERLKAQKRINHAYHLTRIIELSSFYSHDLVRSGLYECQHYNIYTANFLKAYVENHGATPPQSQMVLSPIQRPLSDYAIINK